MHNLSSVYFFNNSKFFGRIWEPSQDNRQTSKKNNKYQLLYPYGVPPDKPETCSGIDEIYWR